MTDNANRMHQKQRGRLQQLNVNPLPDYPRPPAPPGPPMSQGAQVKAAMQHIDTALREYYGLTRKPVVFTKAETDFIHRHLSQVYAMLVAGLERAEKKPNPGKRSAAANLMLLDEMEFNTLATESALCISVLGKLRDSEK